MSDVKLPPLPYPQMPGNDYTAADMRAYAEQAVRDALAAQAAALRDFADHKYLVAIDYARRDEALGWVEKARSGRFGEAEFACHKRMNEAFGAHFGIYEALRDVDPPKENNHAEGADQ
ncbi:hypothetical protein ACOTJC_29020 [Achromobacter xylosoxidans]|uniref:hypothetical protein n=1 Tax=Alcaligenes xylosoxydans xylosoxydans TaxID=85698 RepID=UPI002E17D52D|nr:hypothetical protein [Achromobacter xylosoxidans]